MVNRRHRVARRWIALAVLLGVAIVPIRHPVPARAESGIVLEALVAANATAPFRELVTAFERTHPGVTIETSFAGTQILEHQLEAGAPCDVFLSADLMHAKTLRREGLVGPYRAVSQSHEIVVVPKASHGVATLRDLAKPGVKLVIGVPGVPIGRYTRQIFEKADRAYRGDFERRALANVVSLEVNVKAVLQKVVLNEADAGVVYSTDASPEARRSVRVVEIPKSLNVTARNYVAVATHARNLELARAFEASLFSAQGRAIFARFGYDLPSESR